MRAATIEVNKGAEPVNVLDGVLQRRLPAGEQREDEEQAGGKATHVPEILRCLDVPVMSPRCALATHLARATSPPNFVDSIRP